MSGHIRAAKLPEHLIKERHSGHDTLIRWSDRCRDRPRRADQKPTWIGWAHCTFTKQPSLSRTLAHDEAAHVECGAILLEPFRYLAFVSDGKEMGKGRICHFERCLQKPESMDLVLKAYDRIEGVI